jgi:hypothetical protein
MAFRPRTLAPVRKAERSAGNLDRVGQSHRIEEIGVNTGASSGVSVRHYLGGAIGLVALIVAALFLIPFAPVMPQDGLDPSWRYALNEAVAHGRLFGRDVTFTFGPLGSVYTRMFHPATDTLMIVASAVYATGFVAAFALLAHPRRHVLAVFLPIAISLPILGDPGFLVLPFALLLVVARVTLTRDSPVRLPPSPIVWLGIALSTCAVAMAPVVKGSFTASVVPACGLAFLLLLTRNWRAALGFAVLGVTTLFAAWTMAGQPITALPGFFVDQGPIISGYTDAMAVAGPVAEPLVYIITALILATAFYWWFTRATGWFGWATLLGLLWTLFVAFKAGFVRQDGHILISAGAILLLAYVVSLISRPMAALPVLAIGFAAWAGIMSALAPMNFSFPKQLVVERWNAMESGVVTRLTDPGRLDRDFAAANGTIRMETPLPQVKGTVDIYPWDMSAIFANGLRWSGRPIFQSYSAYEPILDARNVAHLDGPDAPDNVFFTFSPIDHRLPALEDSGSILRLLSAYDVVAYNPPYVQMRRTAAPATRSLDEVRTRVILATVGADVAVDATGPLWASLNLRPTLLGRLVSAAYRLPPVYIVLRLRNGQTIQQRYIPSIGNTGFILSPYLQSPEDFLFLAAGLPDAANVRSFRIVTSRRGLWSPEFEVKLTPIHLTPQPAARALVLTEPSPPPAALSRPFISPKPQCYIDAANGHPLASDGVFYLAEPRLRLQGWTNPASTAGGPDETWISLTSAESGERRFFKAGQQARPDVTKYLQRPSMKNPGYAATLDLAGFTGPQILNIYSLADGKAYDCGFAYRVGESVPPPPALSQPAAGPKPECHLDLVNGAPYTTGALHPIQSRLELQGWTNPPSNPPAGPDETWISLTASETGEQRFFKAEARARPDVVTYLRRPGMKDPGFHASLEIGAATGTQILDIYSLASGTAYLCSLSLRVK